MHSLPPPGLLVVLHSCTHALSVSCLCLPMHSLPLLYSCAHALSVPCLCLPMYSLPLPWASMPNCFTVQVPSPFQVVLIHIASYLSAPCPYKLKYCTLRYTRASLLSLALQVLYRRLRTKQLERLATEHADDRQARLLRLRTSVHRFQRMALPQACPTMVCIH